jgi:hypothetical protein
LVRTAAIENAFVEWPDGKAEFVVLASDEKNENWSSRLVGPVAPEAHFQPLGQPCG